jgi:hypothetical protein
LSPAARARLFYDDVAQNGSLQVIKVGSTNSTAVFAGAFTGSGGSSGGGDIFFLGDLRPGNSPAALTFANNIGFGPTATTTIELGGLSAGAQYDQILVTGDLSLDGALQVSLINGFTPSAGQSFKILDWDSLAGTFSSLALPTLAGLAWNTSRLYTTGLLSVVAAGLTGDYNNDGTVDAADFVVWRKYSGTTTTLPNDPHGGTIGAIQFNTWRAHFGQTAGSGASSNASVPEPASAILLILGAAMANCSRVRIFAHAPLTR